MSIFLHVAGQWKGLGRQPRYCWTRLSKTNLLSKNIFFYDGGPLSASWQCVIFGCNVFLKSFSELLNYSNFSKRICSMYCWKSITLFFGKICITCLGWFHQPKHLQIGCFYFKKIQGCKTCFEVFFEISITYKPNYTLKPLLSQSMVHFTWRTTSVSHSKVY